MPMLATVTVAWSLPFAAYNFLLQNRIVLHRLKNEKYLGDTLSCANTSFSSDALYHIAQPRKLRKELELGKSRKVLLLEHTTFEFARLLILPTESHRMSTRGTHPGPVLRAWLVQHLLLRN
ncbi:uncharacterized protein K441DRAFT_212009 [Cenococcum geophilum 1.58]|uniref:uncharacterized protein n=1 Tax=Cenococcum geophilum 1.58 TaxID=794803 RepID=UPI00358FAF86|nr:hypothetical protein K441DRAFT_212009 [Cenococcum geophilum 1.58]